MNTDLTWLDNFQHPEGGIAYLPGRLPRIEPTAYAILSGIARPEDFLWLQAQLPQRVFKEAPTNSSLDTQLHADTHPWLVAAGILALGCDQSHQQSLDLAACTTYLKVHHGTDSTENLTGVNKEPELTGALPWSYGNYGWIQPTCWAIFAELALLNLANTKSEQERLLQNLTQRVEFVLTRKTTDQGWNYGNTIVQGVELTAHPLETAMVLTAFGGIKNSQLASYLLFLKFDANPTFERLEKLIHAEGSRLTKAWQAIANNCWQREGTTAELALGPPAIGESSLDALLSLLATINTPQQGFHFLYPESES